MEETTFIDVESSEGTFPRAKTGAVDAAMLIDLVVGGLENAGATTEAVMSAMPQTPSFWPLPPRVVKVGNSWIHMKATNLPVTVTWAHDLNRDFRKAVRSYGMCPGVRANLAGALGTQAHHKLLFTDSTPSEEAANLFTAELISALAIPGSKLHVTPGSISRIFAGKRDGIAVLRLNKATSAALESEWLQSRLYKFRGSALYSEVDVIDRCLSWVNSQNLGDYADTLKINLAWLKASRLKEAAYDLEQRLWNLEPKALYTEKVEYGNSLFNLDTLNYIRDIWVNSALGEFEAFREFYGYLVPLYLDDDQFRRMFGTGMVLKRDYKAALGRKIDAGLLNFSAWFSKMIEVNNGK